MRSNDAGPAAATGETTVFAADAVLTRVVTGATWSEGPVWLADRNVLRWSDIPGNRILEVDPRVGALTVHRTDVEFANGRTLDLLGNVVQCCHGRRSIEREIDETITTLVDSWEGRRLNSPNDLVVASDGAIWFTDPPYGISQPNEGRPGFREYGGNFVFRFDEESGEIAPVIEDMDEPNGLAFSPDESVLYVTDSAAVLRGGAGNHHIVAYDVLSDFRCVNGRVFAVIDPGVPDGLRVDVAGRVWTSSGDSIQVFSSTGTIIARVPVPETVANLCFGGDDGTTLFIAAGSSIYSIATLTQQAQRPERVSI